MRALRLATASFALALALAGAGCDVVPPSDKDKQDVIEQTSAGCTALDDKLRKLVRPVELAEVAIFYEQAAGYIDTMLEKLDDFEPPDAADWYEFFGGIRLQRDLIREVADAALDGREKKVSAAERELRLRHARTNVAARKYGIHTKCVELPA